MDAFSRSSGRAYVRAPCAEPPPLIDLLDLSSPACKLPAVCLVPSGGSPDSESLFPSSELFGAADSPPDGPMEKWVDVLSPEVA